MSADPISIEREELYQFAGRILSPLKPGRVLDVACGSGAGTSILGMATSDTQIIGVDLDAGLIKHAVENFQTGRVIFLLADALQLPFPDKSFDRVVCFHAIEHFNEADQIRLLKEVSRVLDDSGDLIIATPDRDVWRLQGIAGVQKDHIRELSQKEFRSILKDCGFHEKGVFGQCILKEDEHFRLRKFLNLLKRMDIIGLRKKIFGNYVRMIDRQTQPTLADFRVRELKPDQKASITVIMCNKTK